MNPRASRSLSLGTLVHVLGGCSGDCPNGLVAEQEVVVPRDAYDASLGDTGLSEEACEQLCADHQTARPDAVGDRTIIDACELLGIDNGGATLACSVETGCTG